MKRFVLILLLLANIGVGHAKMKSEARHVESGTIKIGVAKVEITPREKDFTQQLALRTKDWAQKEVIAPLYVRALVLSKGETKIAIISCDLRGVNKELHEIIQHLITESTGILPSNIMICASHSHSTPHAFAEGDFRLKLYRPSKGQVQYVNSLPGKFAQAVIDACNHLTPAQVGVGKGYEDTIGRNSRRRMKDGNITWVAKGGPPTGPYDPEVGVILIKNLEDAVIATLFNYTCHPMGSNIGGSYVELTCKAIEQEMGGIALFTLGTAGNIHPAPGGTPQDRAQRLAYEVKRIARNIKMSSDVAVNSIKREIVLQARDFNTFNKKLISTIASQAGKRSKAVESTWLAELELLQKENRRTISTSLQVIEIDGALLVSNPGELFVELGMQIKWNSGCEFTFVTNCTNDHIGYIPTRIAYQEGGYQTTQRAMVAPDSGEQIVQEALELCALLTKRKF